MSTPAEIVLSLPDEVESAEQAGLRHIIPASQGIQRRRNGDEFEYVDKKGNVITDENTLKRIRALVLPPAWTSVWISPHANSHIQAVGRDAKGRKQYRYHSAYRAVRDLVKFDRMRAFGRVLPRIRRIVGRDLARPGLPKRKVLAAVVKLLETTYIRIGNEEYAEENGSFGLTTLRNQHVQILGEMLKFKFRGKSGQHHEITLEDKRLARILRRCRDIPGSALFQYIDENGEAHTLESGDVNDYLREISGGDFSAKDFRTWGGTCLAASYLLGKCNGTEADAGSPKAVLVDVVKDVALKLGNKPATCKKYYIHPALMQHYSTGTLKEFAAKFQDSRSNYLYEQIVLALLAPMKRAAKAKVA